MGESRALLAAEAIQCLEKCFKHTFSCYDVRSRFLSALNLDHIARIIYIGRDVTTFSSMVRSRSDNQMVESDTVEYTSYEKKLWYVTRSGRSNAFPDSTHFLVPRI